uniref:Conotoxin n=1 Tax=Conus magus TaxID=6492 RepID=A0A5P8I0S9_CONMA|nr:conotoxin superfamily T [Conus magus]
MRCLPVVLLLLLLLSSAAALAVGSRTAGLQGLKSIDDFGDSAQSLPFLNTICCATGACCGG